MGNVMEIFMKNAGVMLEDIPAELEEETPDSVMVHEWNGGGSDEAE